MAGLFSKGDATAMFDHLKNKWVEFYKNPTEEGLIDTLFPMYHLREWIYRGSKNGRARKSGGVSRAELLNKRLWEQPEYLVVKSLCNHTKHYSCDPEKNPEHKTIEIVGSPAGLIKCGDALNSSYFLVDGRDVRDIFMVIYRIYLDYFEPKDL